MGNLVKKYLKGDSIIWVIIVILSIVSLLSVYSATGFLAYKYQGGNTSHYMFRQLFSLGVGFGVIVLVHNISYKWFARFSLVGLYFSIALLVITLIAGVNLNMASRWLTIPVIGITFQPSEMAKLALIVFVARVLAQHQKEDEPTREAFKPIMFYVMIVAGLIFSENLSTSLLVLSVAMAMMFVGRVPLKYLLGTGLAGVLLIVVVLLLAPKVTFLPRAQTWSSRVEQFFSPDKADRSSMYQLEQSKIAVASGGFFGKGPGNSVQRNFIPHPYSDFIFAIIAEEYGFLGPFVVLLCYLFLLARIGVIVHASTRTFPAFLSLGLGLMLVSQAFVNMGVAVGIFPVTGQPLPLVSLGTTSVLFTCVAFGMILSVSRHNMEEKEKAKKQSAVSVNGEMA
ncbi:FtsW/RodA/SpoVE family cell cycle protein [Natronoflexus pectinivorans]|uniref:Probable peptidoglycan glycosyltransferase FtsW n=1 Tax=Natronoflexus pectinivorans TaxID=682526 RepID=A0A4V2RVN2_9BACT|nr:putative peptidoglycan glycosyltransferase FtsW [Natronoflexus pectinivorans]TCO04954.1 cell division protein FtsW [Natronoflexus pectinivorans]